ncbi:hypothetical protein CC80DRAFT_585559 [Byssothecium circinans]|uniref:lytic cellulose monooxygenase (C4-dehydrogenating) n=1 Tax=Byssothecium circinans TaxID=147558 RepID=A0A6A5U2Z3_9PLEO|nr:hypothetical protein CC80DRAFT_585559 [Byssothecium circinans]
MLLLNILLWATAAHAHCRFPKLIITSVRQTKNYQTNSGVTSYQRAPTSTLEASGNVWFKIGSISAVQGNGPLTSDEKTWPAYKKTSVEFTIPKNVPSGKYLVRVESIALYQAQSAGGAQIYLSCAQVEVTRGGNGTPGPLVAFPGAYSANDPGLIWSYYPIATSYKAPGPAVWTG